MHQSLYFERCVRRFDVSKTEKSFPLAMFEMRLETLMYPGGVAVDHFPLTVGACLFSLLFANVTSMIA